MAETKRKGDLGEALVMAEALRRGYKVAIPIGEDWRYDLIVLRNGQLERVQCKYTESDGEVVKVKCRSTNNWVTIHYTTSDFDWIAVYDRTSNRYFFVPSSLLGNGRNSINLRLIPPKNKQVQGVLNGVDFETW